MDGFGDSIPSAEEMQMQQQQKAAMEEQRLFILDQILEPAAKDRLKRLNLVKADKARSIEDALINAAKNGQLKSKVSEEHLIAMLETGVAAGGSGKVQIQRRKYGMDDDDDDDDDI